uniref:protein-tyrosine-phosphatase n=1 Tax=Microcebus murinus TaxID=30608 RepID=A0A8C5VR48_MICMU
MLEAQNPSGGCERRSPRASEVDSTVQMLQVIPRLYLGGAAAVAKPDQLRAAGISAVLTVDSEEPSPKLGAEIEDLWSLFVPALDKPETDLLSHLDRCVSFITQARDNDRAVLVHCHSAISRSVAVCDCFLMKTDLSTFEEAMNISKTIKPEAMDTEVDTSSAIYKQYRLQKVTEKYPELQNLPQELFAVDPTTISQGLTDQVLYRCRKCRRSLFRRSSVLDHKVGNWIYDFVHKKRKRNSVYEFSCTSYFIEPVQWMESTLLGVMDGQLLCPKCSAKLGSFNWHGEKCSCGRWITPAFQIHKSKVDEMKMLPALGSQSGTI